jgi:hypothetical protein
VSGVPGNRRASRIGRAADDRLFVVVGVIEELETRRPLSGLVVRAFDRDLWLDDALGDAVTGADGRFEIRFETRRFSDLRELRPDLYLEVYDTHGSRRLHTTADTIRWNAALREEFRLLLPARVLAAPARA